MKHAEPGDANARSILAVFGVLVSFGSLLGEFSKILLLRDPSTSKASGSHGTWEHHCTKMSRSFRSVTILLESKKYPRSSFIPKMLTVKSRI